jgi:tRNA G10  N-methylase Trm11
MYIAILGRQPAIGIAELEAVYGNVRWFSGHSALLESAPDLERLGGTLKAGQVIFDMPRGDWRKASLKIVNHYAKKWRDLDGKITLGLSAYDMTVNVRDIQKTGLILKSKLKDSGVSLRLIPNVEPALSTATSHHNKLGLADNKIELIVVASKDRLIVAESIGAQNITRLARRDQNRPKRDAFVGMLPPKLAQIIVNLAVGELNTDSTKQPPLTVLDPFCGTGVILQESALMGFKPYGTDLADKMIDFSRINLEWLADDFHTSKNWRLAPRDAMTAKWQAPVDAIASEAYLGQPFSAPPTTGKLTEVRGNCNHIISGFLENIAPQIKAGTPICLAIPAWRDNHGNFTHLPLINNLAKLGYQRREFTTVKPEQLLYYRENQIVARELLVLVRA